MKGHVKHDNCMMCKMGKTVKFYGATRCPDCRRSKQFLDERGVVEYE